MGVEVRRSPRQHKQTYDKHMRVISLFIFLPLPPSSSPVPPAFKEQSHANKTAHKFSPRCLHLSMSAVNV